VFQKASELFAVLAAPMRLKIINCLRDGEQTVGELITRIGCQGKCLWGGELNYGIAAEG